MADTPPTEFFIQGITSKGKKFRPSDWSERLAGVMSGFGPGARGPKIRPFPRGNSIDTPARLTNNPRSAAKPFGGIIFARPEHKRAGLRAGRP